MEGRSEPMLPEVQQIIAKATFSGVPQLKEGRSKGLLSGSVVVMHTNWELDACMMTAGRVCKTWQEAYKKYLATQVGEIFEQVRQGAVESALDLCDYNEYDDHKPMPLRSQMVHSIYAGRALLFTMRFRCTKDQRMHELAAFYEVEGRFSARTIPVAPLCCVADRDLDGWQKKFCRQWRFEEAAALDQWLGEQHASFHAEPTHAS